jgi:type III pantothenate kinase
LVSCVRAEIPFYISAGLEGLYIIYSAQVTHLPFGCSPQLRAETGFDRLANVAAMATLMPTKSVLAIDMGTCITYSLLHQGEFLGGAISPGYTSRLRAIHEFTGKLPLIHGTSWAMFPGNNTVDAISSGAWNGTIAEINEFVIKSMRVSGEGLVAILTGGDMVYFEEAFKNIIFADALLTLKGLNAILNLNA